MKKLLLAIIFFSGSINTFYLAGMLPRTRRGRHNGERYKSWKPKKKNSSKSPHKSKYQKFTSTSWRSNNPPIKKAEENYDDFCIKLSQLTIKSLKKEATYNPHYIEYCLNVGAALKNKIHACSRIQDRYTKKLQQLILGESTQSQYEKFNYATLLVMHGAQLETGQKRFVISPQYLDLLTLQLSFGAQLTNQPQMSRAFAESKKLGKKLLQQILTYLDREIDRVFLKKFIFELVRICKKLHIAPNMLIVHGKTALHLAIQYELEDAVELLLANGAYVDMRSSKGFTPLHFAKMIKNKPLIDTLKRYGADETIEPIYLAQSNNWNYLLTRN